MSGKKKLVAILLSLALLAGLVSPAAVAEPAEADWDYEDYEYPILKSDEIEFNVIENARLMETISIPFFNRYFNRFGSAFHSMSQTRINGSNKGIFVVYYIDSTGQAREIASNAFKNESVRIFNLICKLNDMEHLYKFNEFDIDPLKKKSR